MSYAWRGDMYSSEHQPSGYNNRDTNAGYFNPTHMGASVDMNGRMSEQRTKPLIFKDRVSKIRLEGVEVDRQSSPSKKLQRKSERFEENSPRNSSYDENEHYDLNDEKLITVVRTENTKFKKEAVPEEEAESSLGVKEQVKTHSELPLNVSTKGRTRESVVRISAFGGTNATDRPSIQVRMDEPAIRKSVTIGGYQNAGAGRDSVVWTIKKPKTDEEEDLEDDRGGIFCGICTSTKPRMKPSSHPPQRAKSDLK